MFSTLALRLRFYLYGPPDGLYAAIKMHKNFKSGRVFLYGLNNIATRLSNILEKQGIEVVYVDKRADQEPFQFREKWVYCPHQLSAELVHEDIVVICMLRHRSEIRQLLISEYSINSADILTIPEFVA